MRRRRQACAHSADHQALLLSHVPIQRTEIRQPRFREVGCVVCEEGVSPLLPRPDLIVQAFAVGKYTGESVIGSVLFATISHGLKAYPFLIALTAKIPFR